MTQLTEDVIKKRSIIHSRCKVYKGYYDPEFIALVDPDRAIFLFGDNEKRYAKGGQACIRDCRASYGIATKWSPSTDKTAYFTDSEDCRAILLWDLLQLENIIYQATGRQEPFTAYFPEHGLGTGLSEMPTRCPNLFKEMNDIIKERFGIDYTNYTQE